MKHTGRCPYDGETCNYNGYCLKCSDKMKMDNSVLNKVNLAHHPRWIEIESKKGWIKLMCSNCGETKFIRTNQSNPTICPNCLMKMEK